MPNQPLTSRLGRIQAYTTVLGHYDLDCNDIGRSPQRWGRSLEH